MNPLENLAREIARKHSLDPALVCAVVEQESRWNPWAIRYEPAFYHRYVLGSLSDEQVIRLGPTETRARAFSWGLMQVMGQTAREHGFRGPYLSELCQPETGLEIGCSVLQSKMARASSDVRRALLFWNGGGDPAYPKKVLTHMAKYQGM